MDSMLEEWTVFLHRCIGNRIQPDLFAAVVAQLHAKSPLPGRKLAALLLRPRAAGASSIDPRAVVILEQLLVLNKVDASDVLTVTFLCSKDRLPKTSEENPPENTQWNNPPELEEVIFHRLHKVFASEERPVNSTEGLRTLIVVTRWMQVMVTSHTSDTMIQAMAGIQQPQQQSIGLREGLAMLVVGIIENSKILRILDNPKSKGKWMSRHFPTCFSYLYPHPPISYSTIHNCLRKGRHTHKFHQIAVFLHPILVEQLGRVADVAIPRQQTRDLAKAA